MSSKVTVGRERGPPLRSDRRSLYAADGQAHRGRDLGTDHTVPAATGGRRRHDGIRKKQNRLRHAAAPRSGAAQRDAHPARCTTPARTLFILPRLRHLLRFFGKKGPFVCDTITVHCQGQ